MLQQSEIFNVDSQISEVEEKIASLQRDLTRLYATRQALRDSATAQIGDGPHGEPTSNIQTHSPHDIQPAEQPRWPLSQDEYRRYGRQLIVPEYGLQGQLELRSASVLIVGLGGLGCPAASYLAGAGVSCIGLIDHDVVELSNLHRQTLHSVKNIGLPKAISAAQSLCETNPSIQYNVYAEELCVDNAGKLFKQYDIILDCTDHPAIRYLISDMAVRCRKIVVSGGALGTNGQLVTLNSPPRPPGDQDGGPCYRCIWPRPPPAAAALSCSEAGIIGPVVGSIGVLMALRAIQILSQRNKQTPDNKNGPNEMLIFSAFPAPYFRNVRLRRRSQKCIACGPNSTQSEMLRDEDYVRFCSSNIAIGAELSPDERIGSDEYKGLYQGERAHFLIDVREKPQFDIASLRRSINVPFSEFQSLDLNISSDTYRNTEGEEQNDGPKSSTDGADKEDWKSAKDKPLLVICKLGNDSQVVVRKLKDNGWTDAKDIRGGFRSWRDEVDPSWPDF